MRGRALSLYLVRPHGIFICIHSPVFLVVWLLFLVDICLLKEDCLLSLCLTVLVEILDHFMMFPDISL